MRRNFRLIEPKKEKGFVPVRAWCTGFEEGCVQGGETYLRGDWVYVLTRTVYDQEGQAHGLPEPVYVRIGKVDRDDLWPRTLRARKVKAKKR